MQSNRPEIDKDIYTERDSAASVFFSSSDLDFYIDKRCKCERRFSSDGTFLAVGILGTVFAGIHDWYQHVLPAIPFES